MSAQAPAAGAPAPADDRLRRQNPLLKVLTRPELGAVAGAIAVWLFFAIVAGGSGWLTVRGTAAYLEVAAELGILAVPVSLLMIAGEFDLSIGTMIGASGMVIALLDSQYLFPLWFAIPAGAAFALIVGFLNGYLVIKTRLPSFIVTLGTFFILQGVTIGVTRALTGLTTIPNLDKASDFGWAHTLFGSQIGGRFNVSIIWWAAVAVVATYILLRTRFGNWIFGSGGSADAARNLGVPVNRVKITLFMSTALAGWLVATIEAVSFGNADVLRGVGREFEAIIAVVIGGTLLTGGYGSAIGAVFGALIFGMVQQGIVFTGIDSDWYKAFLGGMLILAVLLNNLIRSRVGGRR
ncbi:MAG: ABC transporter permease [Candidatus Dormibacteraeota bacterium]|nr:ABC transporter permease [Candidatus Dormibacteraeota bacterium]